MNTALSARLLGLSLIILLLLGCSGQERVDTRDVVQKKCGALVGFHNKRTDDWNREMEIFRQEAEAIPNEGLINSLTSPFKTTKRITETVLELNHIYSVFAMNVSSIDSSDLPQDVSVHFIDVQSQVAYQAKLLDEAASMDQGVVSSAVAIFKWFDSWNRQEEIYSEKLRALIDSAQPYGFAVEWEN